MLPDEMVKRFRVTDGDDFKLKRFDPGDTCGLALDKNGASELLQTGVKRLRDLQERLFAEKRWSVLIVLQAIDTAGKDGTIEHVMSGVNPQGCEVTSFKAPSSLELRHDFLWRTTCALPERGEIGIFNRSYYEEVLVVRVHEELLRKQGLPPKLIGKHVWRDRFESIRDFEKHLARNGTVVLKFFLNLSKDEQRRRFLSRIDEPDKNWKFDAGDLAERRHWDDYQAAYQDAIAETATKHAPWHVVPADNKWFTRLIVAATIVDRLEKLDPQFPVVDDEARKVMAKARKELLAEDGKRKR
ncbi:polyphosphate kinase 2 family protein [Bosea sp. (in: a-proteobacteria)]|uniref:polyphosphate kinase 2 family protein n=1 Tax=Bosea sp. (in: a-proteobacteria) TaxID=1871050 RepID=UPI0025BF0DBF|nr:polyphosphate kinase 2 family protein [Bosea sp. (in: a-proteobacteria)]MBR3194070.1 polyphosphate kinase 2 family protein [Bosea sp. (in: a-proteobacteria)]